MAEYVISGTVQKLFATEVVGTNNFYKRDIVIRTEDQYPQDISVQFVQDKCETLDVYQPGTKVNVHFNLRGRLGGFTNDKGETRYFNTVQGWKIQRADGQQPVQGQSASLAAAPPVSAPATKEYVHTATFSLQEALGKNWTYDALVAGGHGYWKEAAPVAAPGAPAAPAPTDDLPF